MNDETRVSLASYGDGRNLMLTYRDPTTGRKVAKTSGTTDRQKAELTGRVEHRALSGRV